MRGTLLHNPDAGQRDHNRSSLLRLLRDVGIEAAYIALKNRAGKRILRDPGDLFVVAGGDGTLRFAIAHLRGRQSRLACCRLEVLTMPRVKPGEMHVKTPEWMKDRPEYKAVRE
jgi:diacylglycerol kinase family enzyme